MFPQACFSVWVEAERSTMNINLSPKHSVCSPSPSSKRFRVKMETCRVGLLLSFLSPLSSISLTLFQSIHYADPPPLPPSLIACVFDKDLKITLQLQPSNQSLWPKLQLDADSLSAYLSLPFPIVAFGVRRCAPM
ncbi:unnamed protein product [Boreogadus saida]